MIRRVLGIAAWLAAGGSALGGLYWTFLNTPDSDVFRLTLSGGLVLTMVVVTGFIVNVAVLLALGERFRSSARTAIRRLHWFLVAALPVMLAAWAIGRGDAWIERNAGEIAAWFIVTFDWSDINPLFRAESYVSTWLRWVVVPTAALAALTGLVRQPASGFTLRSVLAGWHWRPLLVHTAAFVLLIVLPSRYLYGEPFKLPPTWVQPVAATLRLGLVGIAIAIGAAIMVVTTSKAAATAMKPALPST